MVDKPKVEEILHKIRNEGGNVNYTRDDRNFVDVLWIQTAEMVHMLQSEKPRLFQNDTTFGTQREGYKLHIPIYHSNKTNMWEVAGLLFLNAETKDKVDTGMDFFRNALISCGCLNSTPLIFFVDKDFDYIDSLKTQ